MSISASEDAPRAARGHAREVAASAGHGAITVVRQGRRSVVSRAMAMSPLRLLTPANHGTAAWVFTSSHGGGLVDGDSVSVDVLVEAGAGAYLSTQASTKVYRSPRGTSATLRGRVGAGGLLVLAPDPVVCFAGSRYRQSQHVELSPDADLVVLDWVSSGRQASGERWAFLEYASRTVVHVDDRLLVHDAVALRAADGDMARRLGRFDVLALVALVGPGLAREASALVDAWSRAPVARRPDELVSAAAVGEAGCVVRVAGRSVEQVGRTVRRMLAFVPARLGDDPWSRKW